MAGAILLVGAIAWLLAGAAFLAVAAVATTQLEQLLPPLLIDTDALRGTLVAIGGGLLAVGLTHVVVLIGLRARRRWGSTAAILLCALLSATLFAVAVAGATSAAATPEYAPMFLAGVVAAGIAAVAYGLVAARLVSQRKSGSVH